MEMIFLLGERKEGRKPPASLTLPAPSIHLTIVISPYFL